MGLQQKIQFRKLWNCCWGNEAAVIVFDNGARHAVCRKCANCYTGEVQALDEAGVAEFHEWVREPRSVGDLCYNGYWMEHYVVLNISNDGEFTVLWLGDRPTSGSGDSDGSARVTTHRTAWDPRRDRLNSVGMLDTLDADEDGAYASYDQFLEVARDAANYTTYVNEIQLPN
jgi:hypothetical protein